MWVDTRQRGGSAQRGADVFSKGVSNHPDGLLTLLSVAQPLPRPHHPLLQTVLGDHARRLPGRRHPHTPRPQPPGPLARRHRQRHRAGARLRAVAPAAARGRLRRPRARACHPRRHPHRVTFRSCSCSPLAPRQRPRCARLESGADAVLAWPLAPERVRAWACRLVDTRQSAARAVEPARRARRWSGSTGDSEDTLFLDRVRLAVEAGNAESRASPWETSRTRSMPARANSRGGSKALTGEVTGRDDPPAAHRPRRASAAPRGTAVAEVAEAVGFRSRSHFGEAFQCALRRRCPRSTPPPGRPDPPLAQPTRS